MDLELGNRKPSQLLRHMKTLAGNRVSQDILRVRWLALLPPGIQRVLKILRTTSLEELSSVADELMDGASSSQVLTVSTQHRAPSLCRIQPPSGPVQQQQQANHLTKQVSHLQQSVAHLTTMFEKFLPYVVQSNGPGMQRRVRSRARSRSSSVNEQAPAWCYYHRRFAAARQCASSCGFAASGASSNTSQGN